jgi:hypothetical protein
MAGSSLRNLHFGIKEAWHAWYENVNVRELTSAYKLTAIAQNSSPQVFEIPGAHLWSEIT